MSKSKGKKRNVKPSHKKKVSEPVEPKLRLIDHIEKNLIDAGYTIRRDSWRENMHSDPPNDHCAWLDIFKEPIKPGINLNIHLYFTNNATVLAEVQMYQTEFALVERDTKILF